MKTVLGCIGLLVFLFIIEAAIDALLALVTSWLLTFTPWHLSFMTCFALFYILSIVTTTFGSAFKRKD